MLFNIKQRYSVLAWSILEFRTTETIARLIELGANVDWKHGWKRQSLLHIAAKCGNVDAVRFLQTSTFNMNIYERDWSFTSSDEYLRKLYKKRATYGFSNQQINHLINIRKDLNLRISSENKTVMIETSVENMNFSAVEHFLKDGADFIKNNKSKYRIVLELFDNFELEPGSKILKSLINSGIIEVHNNSLFVLDDNGKNFLLHMAIKMPRARIEMITLLVDEYNQNMNVTDDKGKTPLQCLLFKAFFFDLDLANFLLSKGADATVLDDEGNSLLHLAASKGNMVFVTWSLNLGLEVNAANANGESSLHQLVAGYWGEAEPEDLAGKLCDHGANAFQLDKKGRGVLHHLAGSNNMHEEVLNYFLQKGVDINAVDNEGNTPLHIASNKLRRRSNDDGDVRVKLLLNNGADKTIQNINGETPYAIYKLEILKL